MSDYSELKRVAEELIAANDLFFNESPQCNEVGDAWSLADDRFTEAASPEVILALIAENERLKNRLEVDPRHDYDGISTRDATVKVLDEQVDQLKAENERLRADYAGLARFNPEWDRVAAAQDSVREHMAMVVQLKAEIASLKTGYQAYEQVNAELKAEVEGLRESNDKLTRRNGMLEKNVEVMTETHVLYTWLRKKVDQPSNDVVAVHMNIGHDWSTVHDLDTDLRAMIEREEP